MTAEQRTVIEPRDILAIELECKCGSRVRYPVPKMQPDVFKSRQHACPNCKEGLIDGPEANRIAELVEALSVLIKGGSENIKFEIRGFSDGREAEKGRTKTGAD